MKRTLLVAVLAAALTGCATAPQVMTQNKYVPIPKALLVKCKTEQPPGRGTYPTLSWPDKETAWTTYSSTQINDNTTCNKNTDLLIQWDAQQNALYNGASAPGAASAPGGAK
jgi:opacity protein-like surface antigen